MKTVNLEELKGIMNVAWDDKDDGLKLVIFNLPECHHCTLLRDVLLTEPMLTRLQTVGELLILDVGDRIPLFAPPVLPCVIGFKYGVRVWESLGYPDDVEAMVTALEIWVGENTSDSMSISEGYRSL